MGKVIPFGQVTHLDSTPLQVLSAATDADLDSVIVIGRNKDGTPYFNSTSADGGDVLWELECVKHALMKLGADA